MLGLFLSTCSRYQRMFMFVVIKVILINIIIIKPNNAWYDTSTSIDDLYSLENSSISNHHNPKEGTLQMRKRSRTDGEILDMINYIRTRQATFLLTFFVPYQNF